MHTSLNVNMVWVYASLHQRLSMESTVALLYFTSFIPRIMSCFPVHKSHRPNNCKRNFILPFFTSKRSIKIVAIVTIKYKCLFYIHFDWRLLRAFIEWPRFLSLTALLFCVMIAHSFRMFLVLSFSLVKISDKNHVEKDEKKVKWNGNKRNGLSVVCINNDYRLLIPLDRFHCFIWSVLCNLQFFCFFFYWRVYFFLSCHCVQFT